MSDISYTREVIESRATHEGVLSGDPCPDKNCRGRMKVANVKRSGGWIIRYHVCSTCGKRPENNKWMISDKSATS